MSRSPAKCSSAIVAEFALHAIILNLKRPLGSALILDTPCPYFLATPSASSTLFFACRRGLLLCQYVPTLAVHRFQSEYVLATKSGNRSSDVGFAS